MAKVIPAGPTVPRNWSGSITAGSVISHVASCTQLLDIGIDGNAEHEPNRAHRHKTMTGISCARVRKGAGENKERRYRGGGSSGKRVRTK